ncbi:tRNA glutamyl-Q(34) synthetase GluQRS [Pelagovum pacificum]|uniref:tRNA glutamyl-Q(34) synthetase GluQRS n=1 Tax=Pelagovum pacificum TaxID=2588711 RepID=A0A5C5GE34_9RHOB|nr:tRNA glutamyl-Q(34) synthetase GluQRS [Pelagovum pacificum]QQA44651.1 tRNA glutamyl-Q(34) synthetase GluQRS [Pelagovum pacificum]TNY32239.1 tRNA glutamyl-Q(34) synthetase GluQRS [Pelagovum pacificum]
MITRFAPSPTGPLHLGHAFSAITAWRRAQEAGGTFLLRIEDLDQDRSKPEWDAQIFEDLAWLGLDWSRPVRRQSEHLSEYGQAIDRLAARGLVFPCSCTRGDIRAALSAPQEGALATGPDGLVYPGTCRGRSMESRRPGDALRLDIRKALATIPGALSFLEHGRLRQGQHDIDPDSLIEGTGDIVLSRRDGAVAYHLAVVHDDALQGVTEVVRGADLFDATPVQVLLQALLGLPTPDYDHHDLVRDDAGRRLAKRDDARAIATYRDDGLTPQDIRAKIALQFPEFSTKIR